MKHLQQSICLAMMSWLILFAGCQNVHLPGNGSVNKHQASNNNVDTQNQNQQQVEQVQQEEAIPENGMKVAFYYPVVQVGNRRIKNIDPLSEKPQRIVVVFPENTTNNISIRFVDIEGVEKEINGRISVKQYTEHSKPEGEPGKVIDVSPDNAEDIYERIYQTGYGELTIREYVEDEDFEWQDEVQRPVLVNLELGSKKKSKDIEFRFREGIIYSVEGKEAPTSLLLPEKTQRPIKMMIDDGLIKLEGTIQVYNNTTYTTFAPVWVDIDETTRERLRLQGGKLEIALYVPAEGQGSEEDFVTSIDPEQKPLREGQKRGTVVALLRLKTVGDRF